MYVNFSHFHFVMVSIELDLFHLILWHDPNRFITSKISGQTLDMNVLWCHLDTDFVIKFYVVMELATGREDDAVGGKTYGVVAEQCYFRGGQVMLCQNEILSKICTEFMVN